MTSPRALTLSLAVVACCLALGGVAEAIPCDPGRCTTFQAPGASGPVVAGPDGNAWFVGEGFVGRMDSSGAVTRFPAPVTADSSLVVGSDGYLYFTASGDVGRMGTDGQYALIQVGQPATGPLAASPDGILWLAATSGVMAMRVADMGDRAVTDGNRPARAASRSSVPTPTAMVRGPDGAVWFAASGRAAIGRVAEDGTVTHFPLPPEFGDQIGGMTAGPDGGIWFTAPKGFRVGRLSTRGTFTSYRTSWNPYAITSGPSHAIWFAMTDSGRWTIVRMVPAGYLSYWQLPGPVRGLGVGPDKAVYITHPGSIERLLPFLGAYPIRGRTLPMSPWTYAVTMRFYCPKFDLVYCAGTVVLRYQGRVVGATPFSQRVHDAPSTRLVLNRYGRGLVNRRGRLQVQATLDQHDAGGATRQTTYAFNLVRRHR